MKIVSILGSPHGMKGNTAALMNIVLEGARSRGGEIETIVLKGPEVKPCSACDRCHATGECPQKDEFRDIKGKIEASDGLILATPNYINHVSAQLKAFVDRCCGVVHCLGFEGKYGASVVTAGGGEEEAIAEYLSRFFAITGAMPVGSIWATMSGIENQDFPSEIREKAFSLGRRLVAAWEGHETDPFYGEITAAFRERMKSLVQWRKDEWTFEYEFWKNHGSLKG